jgi:hypothetical protein
MIAVTILARENEISVSRGELVQRKPAVGGIDEKLRSFQTDLRDLPIPPWRPLAKNLDRRVNRSVQATT